METVNPIITHTIEDKWAELDDVAKAEHKLRCSKFYQMVQRGRAMAAQVAEMNKNVDEEFHVRMPNMYYYDGYDLD